MTSLARQTGYLSVLELRREIVSGAGGRQDCEDEPPRQDVLIAHSQVSFDSYQKEAEDPRHGPDIWSRACTPDEDNTRWAKARVLALEHKNIWGKPSDQRWTASLAKDEDKMEVYLQNHEHVSQVLEQGLWYLAWSHLDTLAPAPVPKPRTQPDPMDPEIKVATVVDGFEYPAGPQEVDHINTHTSGAREQSLLHRLLWWTYSGISRDQWTVAKWQPRLPETFTLEIKRVN